MTERIACCVPFCRRTTLNKHGWSEWICGDHWRLIPKPLRRVQGRINRRARRGLAVAGERGDRIWNRLKRAAIERALGAA